MPLKSLPCGAASLALAALCACGGVEGDIASPDLSGLEPFGVRVDLEFVAVADDGSSLLYYRDPSANVVDTFCSGGTTTFVRGLPFGAVFFWEGAELLDMLRSPCEENAEHTIRSEYRSDGGSVTVEVYGMPGEGEACHVETLNLRFEAFSLEPTDRGDLVAVDAVEFTDAPYAPPKDEGCEW
jgi:hypothetical protein